MYLLTMMAAKGVGNKEYNRLEEERLVKQGFEVTWGKHKRHYATCKIQNLDQLKKYWGQDIFWMGLAYHVHTPEQIIVTFSDVDDMVPYVHNGCAVMVDPFNPIYSKLFTFRVGYNYDEEVVYVHADNKQLEKFENLELFIRVLRNCDQNRKASFHSRKRIGTTKRRYLMWLVMNDCVPDELRSLAYGQFKAAMKENQTIGKYEGADTAWRSLVEKEQAKYINL
ncbi:MAG: hypothetical protein ABIE43_00700 [Patescibacteria group bacterium]